jgi:hypothetical protein
VTQAQSPSVRIDKLKLRQLNAERMSTRFVQHYSAGHYRDTVRKTDRLGEGGRAVADRC